jgi:AcrR family transcriptional regulator
LVDTRADDDPSGRVDGRARRTQRTREQLVQANLALLEEGELRASAQRVAERAGVSVRTLFLHFPDMEALFAATAGTILEGQRRSGRTIPPDLPLAVRIDRFTRQRARRLEQLAPYALASQVREPFSPMLRTYRVKHIEVVAAQVEALFAAELPADPRLRQELVQAVTMASTWGSWSILRQHMGLGVARARAVMTRTLTALLSADGPVGRRTPKGRT